MIDFYLLIFINSFKLYSLLVCSSLSIWNTSTAVKLHTNQNTAKCINKYIHLFCNSFLTEQLINIHSLTTHLVLYVKIYNACLYGDIVRQTGLTGPIVSLFARWSLLVVVGDDAALLQTLERHVVGTWKHLFFCLSALVFLMNCFHFFFFILSPKCWET